MLKIKASLTKKIIQDHFHNRIYKINLPFRSLNKPKKNKLNSVNRSVSIKKKNQFDSNSKSNFDHITKSM